VNTRKGKRRVVVNPGRRKKVVRKRYKKELVDKFVADSKNRRGYFKPWISPKDSLPVVFPEAKGFDWLASFPLDEPEYPLVSLNDSVVKPEPNYEAMLINESILPALNPSPEVDVSFKPIELVSSENNLLEFSKLEDGSDLDFRAKVNERQRERYNYDPVFRAKRREYARNRYGAKKPYLVGGLPSAVKPEGVKFAESFVEKPGLSEGLEPVRAPSINEFLSDDFVKKKLEEEHERQSERQRERNRKYRAKINNDPELRAKWNEYQRELWRERYNNDPELRAKVNEYQRERSNDSEVSAKKREYDRERYKRKKLMNNGW
jgi:hypothetical protein